jgi:hypothetical protein
MPLSGRAAAAPDWIGESAARAWAWRDQSGAIATPTEHIRTGDRQCVTFRSNNGVTIRVTDQDQSDGKCVVSVIAHFNGQDVAAHVSVESLCGRERTTVAATTSGDQHDGIAFAVSRCSHVRLSIRVGGAEATTGWFRIGDYSTRTVPSLRARIREMMYLRITRNVRK